MGLTVMRVNLQRILRTCFVQRALLQGTRASQAGNERGTPWQDAARWPLAPAPRCHLSSLAVEVWTRWVCFPTSRVLPRGNFKCLSVKQLAKVCHLSGTQAGLSVRNNLEPVSDWGRWEVELLSPLCLWMLYQVLSRGNSSQQLTSRHYLWAWDRLLIKVSFLQHSVS